MSATSPLPVDPEDAYALLTPTQRHVWALLQRPEGICRRVAAMADVYELANRISEIESRLDVRLERDRCRLHDHRHPMTRYRIPQVPGEPVR